LHTSRHGEPSRFFSLPSLTNIIHSIPSTNSLTLNIVLKQSIARKRGLEKEYSPQAWHLATRQSIMWKILTFVLVLTMFSRSIWCTKFLTRMSVYFQELWTSLVVECWLRHFLIDEFLLLDPKSRCCHSSTKLVLVLPFQRFNYCYPYIWVPLCLGLNFWFLDSSYCEIRIWNKQTSIIPRLSRIDSKKYT
jgi:hypothetical protein